MCEVRIKDYLYITDDDINNFDIEIDNGKEVYIPKSYQLWFRYHDTDITAAFTINDLRKAKDGNILDSSYSETEGDLLTSFEEQLEEDEVIDSILECIEHLWNKTFTNNKYDYLGYVSRD